MITLCKEDILHLYAIKDSERTSALVGWMLSEMPLHHIDNAFRVASYLAQIGHESGCLRYVEEIADGSYYEGRKDLGNVQKGDGRRFKGRGLIQITGRSNYARCAEALGIDCLHHPQMLCRPEWAVKSSMWYWDEHDLNSYADKDDLRGQTRVINGGYNGYEDRKRLYVDALTMLGA